MSYLNYVPKEYFLEKVPNLQLQKDAYSALFRLLLGIPTHMHQHMYSGTSAVFKIRAIRRDNVMKNENIPSSGTCADKI